jgi:hypothetical protein
MDNRINEIRKQIRALRVSMLEAENIMRDQINRDEECSEIAGEIMVMRAVLTQLVGERARLGDREPILVNCAFIPRRAPAAPRTVSGRPVKRHLVARGLRMAKAEGVLVLAPQEDLSVARE